MTNNDKVEVLKPCPFCGGPAKVRSQLTGAYYTLETQAGHEVTCPFVARPYATEAEAITAWNTRTPDEIVEALEAALCAQTWAECLGHVHEAQAKARGHD